MQAQTQMRTEQPHSISLAFAVLGLPAAGGAGRGESGEVVGMSLEGKEGGSSNPHASTDAGPSKRQRKHHGKPVTAKWQPVYTWLESLDQQEVVHSRQILKFLEEHHELKMLLLTSHSYDHVNNYIQKAHTRMLADQKRDHNMDVEQNGKKGVHHEVPQPKLQPKRQLVDHKPFKKLLGGQGIVKKRKRKRWSGINNAIRAAAVNLQQQQQQRAQQQKTQQHQQQQHGKLLHNAFGRRKRSYVKRSSGFQQPVVVDPYKSMDKEALCRRYILLQHMHKVLAHILNSNNLQHDTDAQPRNNVNSFPHSEGAMMIGKKNRESLQAWAFTEGTQGNNLSSRALIGEGNRGNSSRSVLVTKKRRVDLVKCLQEREGGGNSETVAFRPMEVGIRGRRWASYVQGWSSLGRQFDGPVARLHQEMYSSWLPSWCAYTSSVALNQPTGGADQGVQKVLDLRFHPGGLPQLVCSCNAAPNELLLYNLVNGRARELNGHNSQIQAVEFALGGDSIVSCGTNVVKVWDSSSGLCLHSMGPVENGGSSGHRKKISAMAVQHLQSCLVATSGGEGASEILLWNVRTGELASDLNFDMRQRSTNVPSMDALHFCNQNLLICGSDAAGAQSAVVQIWDVEAVKDLMTFPANDSYVTCLSTNPAGTTVITGSGDGSVGLFDIRCGGGIARLGLGLNCEATSVSFSSCGRYFHASSTSNNTLVWDTRMMCMDPGPVPNGKPMPVSRPSDLYTKPVHCLSHGEPMPTTQNAGQLAGYVDEGDGGVNDARWFHNQSILVTASGNGSLAVWDVTLGQPCVKFVSSHTRCVNTVAISPDDKLVCSGGDDQKVVLYQSVKESIGSWRLTHPLCEEFHSLLRVE